MLNNYSFLADAAVTTFAIIFSAITLFFLVGVVLFIWWVDTKKRPFKDFWKVVGDKFVFLWTEIVGLFTHRNTVKTVYSDKTLNYSGTEFLPIPMPWRRWHPYCSIYTPPAGPAGAAWGSGRPWPCTWRTERCSRG